MIERETKREKTLESAAREKRLKAQAKRPASGNNKTVVTEDGFDQVKEEFFKCLEEHDKPKKGHAKEQQPEAEN